MKNIESKNSKSEGAVDKLATENAKKEKVVFELQKEIDGAVGQALSAPESEREDIQPAMRYALNQLKGAGIGGEEGQKLMFKKEARESVGKKAEPEEGLVDQERKKIFWGLVGESLKNTVFKAVYSKLIPLVEKGEYGGAEDLIKEEMRKSVKTLSPTVYRDQDELAVALTELRSKFYESLPEVKALIYGAAEGKKPRAKIPAGETSEEYLRKSWMEQFGALFAAFGGGRGGEKEPYFLKEKNWDVPKLEEIRPGMVVEVENVESRFTETIHVLSKPFQDDGGYGWKVKAKGGPVSSGEIFLADRGIAPYSFGLWNPANRPVKWYMAEGGAAMEGSS